MGIDNAGESLPGVQKTPDSEKKRRDLPLPNYLPTEMSLYQFLPRIPDILGPLILNQWRECVGWHLLISKPGLARQIVHKDFDMVVQDSSDDVNEDGVRHKRTRGRRDAAVPVEQMPLSIIISFDDETYWYGPHDEKIQIKAGNLLIFRGDIPHSGAESSVLNVRLHSYFDHPSLSSRFRYGPDHEKAIFYTQLPAPGKTGKPDKSKAKNGRG